LQRGHTLGIFRAYGQLGRSLGPLVFCLLYWIYGSFIVYMGSGMYMLALASLWLFY
jgi:hypothetical protein